MRKSVVIAAVAAAQAGWAMADEPPPPGATGREMITNPDWVRKPGQDEFSRYYPSKATTTGVVGIECVVTAEGKTSGCVVLNEDPTGQGFGEAALKIATFFQMKPTTLDGKPVGGGIFRTNIRFFWEGELPPQWVTRPTEAQLQAVWPEKAKGVAGLAVLNCTVSTKGRVHGCMINKEEPRGMGFGAAALKLVPTFVLTQPKTERAGTLLPVVFSLPKPRQLGMANYGSLLTGLVNAPWKSAPGIEDMTAAWPSDAPADLATARVRLRCGFKPDGGLSGCEILSEDPGGLGFGKAALALTARFQTSLEADADGKLAKAKLILPIWFANPKRGSPAPEQITEYNWVRFLDQDQATNLYPQKAAKAGILTGLGVVACRAGRGGSMEACVVEREDPAQMGFGEAAVAAAAYFTVNPWTDDGRPVEGAKLRLPIRFNEPKPEGDTAPKPAASGG